MIGRGLQISTEPHPTKRSYAMATHASGASIATPYHPIADADTASTGPHVGWAGRDLISDNPAEIIDLQQVHLPAPLKRPRTGD